MESIYSRTEMLIGEDGINVLKSARVIVFGAGGVGGYVIEALARAGIGTIGIVDNDVISISNLNRQILATVNNVGRKKVDVAKERILSINPACNVKTYDIFYLPETAESVALSDYDFVVDAIDTVTAKVKLACDANAYGVKIVSSMGTGNKLNPRFVQKDLFSTAVCPLARIMRKELRNAGLTSLPVVYSEEEPACKATVEQDGRRIPGSISFVPAAAGITIAGYVINTLLKNERSNNTATTKNTIDGIDAI